MGDEIVKLITLDAIRARHVDVLHECAARDDNFPPYRTFSGDEACDTAIVLAALDAATDPELLAAALVGLQVNGRPAFPDKADRLSVAEAILAALATTPEGET